MSYVDAIERALGRQDGHGCSSEFTFRECGDGLLLFEAWSPAGEDIPLERGFDDPSLRGIADWVGEEWREYDADEHVELWAGSRGENGVPGTVRELLDDAGAIGEMLHDLWRRLDGAAQANGR